MRAAILALTMLAMPVTGSAETVKLYAAGSLQEPLDELGKAYQKASGNKVEAKYGPSGRLKEEIAAGAKADVFASASMEHPQALFDDDTSGPVVRFARNKMCALVKGGLAVTTDNLLAHMLDRKVKLGTSTPRLDPSGDYALQTFVKAEALKAGAQEMLEQKALKLTGGKDSATPPAGRIAYGWHVDQGRADIFLTYCTNALAAQKQYPAQQLVELPETLAVGADYGLTVINGAPASAQQFAEFILSKDGQTILTNYGFAPGE
jgi:molybdate transport system substrate-binding protein